MRVVGGKWSLPPLCFPFILTFLLYIRTNNVTQYFWILTSRLTRGGWRCSWYRRQNYVQAQSCELICMYKRIQVTSKILKEQRSRPFSQNLFNSNFNVIRSCFVLRIIIIIISRCTSRRIKPLRFILAVKWMGSKDAYMNLKKIKRVNYDVKGAFAWCQETRLTLENADSAVRFITRDRTHGATLGNLSTRRSWFTNGMAGRAEVNRRRSLRAQCKWLSKTTWNHHERRQNNSVQNLFQRFALTFVSFLRRKHDFRRRISTFVWRILFEEPRIWTSGFNLRTRVLKSVTADQKRLDMRSGCHAAKILPIGVRGTKNVWCLRSLLPATLRATFAKRLPSL